MRFVARGDHILYDPKAYQQLYHMFMSWLLCDENTTRRVLALKCISLKG